LFRVILFILSHSFPHYYYPLTNSLFQRAIVEMLFSLRLAVVLFVVSVVLPSVHTQHAGASSQVLSIFPNFGSFDGNTPVTVTGSGFLNSWTLCKFGSIAQ
jgi:hypothetical protein